MNKESYFVHSMQAAIQEGKTKVDIADGKSSVIEKEDAKVSLSCMTDYLLIIRAFLLIDFL